MPNQEEPNPREFAIGCARRTLEFIAWGAFWFYVGLIVGGRQ